MRAKKSLGQNFLVDPHIQRQIVEALEATADDAVLEIGPGTGALTQHLAGHVRRLVVVELDDRLADALAQRYAGRADVRIVHGDILDLDVAALVAGVTELKIIGNIPYNITTPLIFRLLDVRPRPERLVLMVQREVADRILAAPRKKTYGALSVGVRVVADVQKILRVSRGAFRPVPAVDSTVLRLRPRRPAPLTSAEETDVRTLTRAAFGWRRKQLQKTLRAAPEYGLDAGQLATVEQTLGVSLRQRAETLAPEQFVTLARALRSMGLPDEG